MALVHADFVEETTITTGTGTLSLAGATTGNRTFVAAIGSGNTCIYGIRASDGSYESGVGTVTDATPDTLARTTLIASTTGSKLDLPAGTHTVYCTFSGEGGAKAYAAQGALPAASTQTFTVGSGTWTKPTGNYRYCDVFLVCGGNGGGSGARVASGTACSGGGGGSGATALWIPQIPFADMPSSASYTVGGGGAGGAAKSTDGAGNAGTQGSVSAFHIWSTLNGNAGGGGQSAANSAAGTSSGSTLNGVQAGNGVAGTQGAAGTAGAGAFAWGPGGGASGGGISATPTAFSGSSGGSAGLYLYRSAGAATIAGGSIGTAGVNGGNAGNGNPGSTISWPFQCGSAGGGGAASTTANGGAGGNGGFPGGGGGGGAAAIGSYSSGAGGNGADGVLIVRCY